MPAFLFSSFVPIKAKLPRAIEVQPINSFKRAPLAIGPRIFRTRIRKTIWHKTNSRSNALHAPTLFYLQPALEDPLFPFQLCRQRSINLPSPAFVRIIPKPIVAMPIIYPPGMIQDRVKTNPMHWGALFNSRPNFSANITQPPRTHAILGARLGHKERPMIAFVYLSEHLAERAVIRTCPGNGRKLAHVPEAFEIVEPLVVRIEIHSNQIEELLLASQFRPNPSC